MTLKCTDEPDTKTRWHIHMLNPGEIFPRFGGSSAGLLVRKTASMIVQRRSPFDCTDTEYSIYDPKIWEWMTKGIAMGKLAIVEEEATPA